MKKYFEYLGILGLFLFSSYFMDRVVGIVKDTNEVMKRIESDESLYNVDSIDSIIIDDKIIPGLVGKEIDKDASYKVMKESGVYDPNNFIYKIKNVKNSLSDHKEKYIISGNPNKMMVSILIRLNGHELEDINIDKKYTIVINSKDILNNKELKNSKYDFIIESNDKEEFNNIRSSINSKHICLFRSTYDNSYCYYNNYYSIYTDNVIDKEPLLNTKKIVRSGSIIVYNWNKELERELSSITRYIVSRGLKVVPITEHLKEA